MLSGLVDSQLRIMSLGHSTKKFMYANLFRFCSPLQRLIETLQI